MGGGQTLNFGFRNYTVFNWIGAFNSAPNTVPAGQTIKDPAAVKANVRFTYVSCGTADGLLSHTNNYHAFLDANSIEPHMYQLEQGEAHSWTSFNRGFYHFVQRIFPANSTGLGPIAGKGMRGAPMARLVLRTGRIEIQGSDLAALFTLDGRYSSKKGKIGGP
jgi:acetyl esterase/lipase